MADTVRWTGSTSPQRTARPESQQSGTDLADILERVLDKGIVIAGDIQVNLLDVELLTIKIRLVVASVDRAKEMGIDWWERDPTLSAGRGELEDENARLRERIERLEAAASDNGQGSDTAELPEGRDDVSRTRPGREREPAARADRGPDGRSEPESGDELDDRTETEDGLDEQVEADEQAEPGEQAEPDEQVEAEDAPEPEDRAEPEDRGEPEAEEAGRSGDDEDTDERPRRQRSARPKRRR